ncbi:MAG TPA: hypothetical protein VIY86_01600, partial [Pirellulaceae bacterium]
LGPTAVLKLIYATAVSPGDFDGDGQLTCSDIDSLVGVVASGSGTAGFDLTGDSLVDIADVNYWVATLKETLPGDANLDFVVDGSDFGVWNGNKFTMTPRWCAGDINADGGIDASDFGIWNANKFQAALSIVPECSGALMVAAALVSTLTRRRRIVGPARRAGHEFQVLRCQPLQEDDAR